MLGGNKVENDERHRKNATSKFASVEKYIGIVIVHRNLY